MTTNSLAANQGPFWKLAVTNVTPVYPSNAAGYNNIIFFDDFLSTSSIDMTNSQAAGFHWYLANWFVGGATATAANNISVSNSILTIGGGTGSGPNIVTAFDTGVTDAFRGTVFGTGSYFEISMKFNPLLSGNSALGTPNFYGMSIEHIADNGAVSLGKWPGQANGFAHFIEVDIFEPSGGSLTQYLSTTHDWGNVFSGGVWTQNIINGATSNVAVGGIDFTQFHTYGCLWVPQNGSTPGRLQRFFDNVLYSSVYYLGPTGSPPLPGDAGQTFSPSTPAAGDRTYSVIDSHHLALLIGGGTTWPIQVDWIRVWK